MNLNVKDPEAYRLAQAISRATGESMTHVVREVLRERFAKRAAEGPGERGRAVGDC